MAQALLETAEFSSKIKKENLNRFGMKDNRFCFPGTKDKISLGEKNGHAYYAKPEDSYINYAVYQKAIIRHATRPIVTEEDYLWLLEHINLPYCHDCRYAEDPNYIDKVRMKMRALNELEAAYGGW